MRAAARAPFSVSFSSSFSSSLSLSLSASFAYFTKQKKHLLFLLPFALVCFGLLSVDLLCAGLSIFSCCFPAFIFGICPSIYSAKQADSCTSACNFSQNFHKTFFQTPFSPAQNDRFLEKGCYVKNNSHLRKVFLSFFGISDGLMMGAEPHYKSSRSDTSDTRHTILKRDKNKTRIAVFAVRVLIICSFCSFCSRADQAL